MPYTHNWRAVHALNTTLAQLDVQESIVRHQRVAQKARDGAAALGLALFAPLDLASPTCTALLVPPDTTWTRLRSALRKTKVWQACCCCCCCCFEADLAR
jgi:aspartate aminotransferase-like enzyme